MKKTLSLILAVMMLLGCMSVTAFAEEPDNSTDITLTVAKALTYDMVIPEDVTNLDAAGIYSVGQAKVQNVKNATEKTVISYTATTTNFTSEGKAAIPASYYTDAQGTAFPTTAVEVYKNKADAASIPTMYVGISENDWNAAENGTYTATVTYNFSAEEAAVVTYMDWDSVNKKLVEKSVPADDAIEVTSETATLDAGKFYVVKGTDVQINSPLIVNGTTAQPTTLILMDGAKLTVTGTIKVSSGKALVITGQSGGTGELTANGVNGAAGIGGIYYDGGGNVTINGGTVTATGDAGGAGIGGGDLGAGGDVTINGGTVTANGVNGAAGIGGGRYSVGGTVTFGVGVNFTVNAGADEDNTTSMTTGDYESDHSAAYVKITPAAN